MDHELPSNSLVAGKYILVRRIGQGGMGSVWEGKHQSLGTRVAIKFIDREHADNQEARARFDREARAAAAIQSKHAIQIFDHGITDDGKPFIVMEMLEGESLEDRLKHQPVMPLKEVAVILQQVCRAVQKAHDAGVVHRDLKPDNIYLCKTAEDDHETAKVLDFGIAKVQGGTNPALSSGTKTGAVIGTPFFMSPEQARGLRAIDHRTDIWSLGVIAYRAVVGKLPFDGESVGDLLVKICTAPLPRPSAEQPSLSGEFDLWFARALAREPADRFSSANDFADALLHTAGLPNRSGRGSVTPAPPAIAANAGSRISDGGISAAPFTATPAQTGEFIPRKSALPMVVGLVAVGFVIVGGGFVVSQKMSTRATRDSAAMISSPTPSAAAASQPSAVANIPSGTDTSITPLVATAVPVPSASASAAPAPAAPKVPAKTGKPAQKKEPAVAILPAPTPPAKPTKKPNHRKKKRLIKKHLHPKVKNLSFH